MKNLYARVYQAVPIGVVLIAVFSFPHVASAAWWNPFSWFAKSSISTATTTPVSTDDKVAELTKKIDDLQKKLDAQASTTPKVSQPTVQSKPSVAKIVAPVKPAVSAVQANVPVVVVPAPSVQAQAPINFTLYKRMTVDDYGKNPAGYFNTGVKIKAGIVDDFLAAGDKGGSTNYIEITDALSDSAVPSKLMINVPNASDYQKLVSTLNKGDFVAVYGLGAASQTLQTTSLIASYTHYVPVISVQRVDKCDPYDCTDAHVATVFSVAPSATTASTPQSSISSNIVTDSTQRSLRSQIYDAANLLTNNMDFQNNIGSYNSSVASYYASQPNGAGSDKFVVMAGSVYQKFINAIDVLNNEAVTFSNMSSYRTSADLSGDQQDKMADLSDYAQQKVAEYNAKIATWDSAMRKYISGPVTISQSDMVSASRDLATAQQYLSSERIAFIQKLTGVLDVFIVQTN